jgi:urease accessory protein
MIIEKAVRNITDASAIKNAVFLDFDWHERERRILVKKTEAGEEIGLRLSEPLNDGDVLFENEGKTIIARLSPCDLIHVEASTMKEMGRICHELGNRHLPISISEDSVLAPYDSPAFEHLSRMGFRCRKVREKLLNPIDVKGHSHSSHSHG